MNKKRIISIFLLVFTLFGVFNFITPTKVEAATNGTLSHPKTDGVYYTRRGGGKPYMSAQYEQYTMNGKVVYCIEPGVDITNTSYLGYDGLQASPYDEATNKKIELIGHYGYDYPGHQTLRYRMATQALIWETTGGQIIEFWTEQYGYGDYININAERNEIMRLVNAHYNKPSFNGKSMEVIVGKEYKITDTNGLMSEYELYSASNMNVRIEGNDIYVTPLATGNLTLNVVRKHYDNHTTIVYHGEDGASQKMGFFRFSDPVVASVKLNVLGGKIQIKKVDAETNSTTPQGAATLVGAKYNVINSNGSVVSTLTIGEDMTAITDNLPLGTYTIKEVSAPTGYELDKTTYTVTVNSSDTVNITVKDNVIKGKIKVGKYYIVEENPIEGYVSSDEKVLFEIKENGEEKPMQKSGYATKKEANNARNIAITELHNGTFVVNCNVNVKQFFTYWLEKVMRPSILTSDSYDAYKNIVYNHIIPSLGTLKMTTLSRSHIQKFYNEKTQFSHNVAKLCKAVMNTALKYALEKKLVKFNAALDIELPKCVKKKKYRTIEIDTKKTLNEEQVRLLIEKSKDTPIHLQVLFAVLMGLRKQEINGLKYSDIDYIHRTLKVQRQLGKKPNTDNSELKVGEYTKQEIEVKTFSSNRELEIPDIVFEAILEERKKYERNRSRRINDKTTPFKDYDFICCSTYGNPRSKSFHFKYWKALLKDNNLPNIRFHDLRATYCTLLIKNNFNLKAISKQMGHATEIISVDVYGDNEEIISDCLDELEPFIDMVKPEEEIEEYGDELLIDIDEEYINALAVF